MTEGVGYSLELPRIVRPAPDPLALHLRPGRNDHRELLNLMAAGDTSCFGAIFDPTILRRHKELKDQVIEHRRAMISALASLPIAACWLSVDEFDRTTSPTATRTYIEAAAEFHELGVPIVADHVGGVIGLAILAFGAAGGIAHGVTLGERF